MRLDEAGALIAAGDFTSAKAVLEEATAACPEVAAAWKQLGVAEDKLGNAEAAERHLLTSLGLDDADGDAWSVLGGLYFYDLERPKDALRCFRRSLALDPADPYALMNCLTIVSIAGSAPDEFVPALAESERRCAAQIDRQVNLPWCYYDLAQALFFQERTDEARSLLRQAFARSNGWQVASARLPYERLTRVDRLADRARAMVRELDDAG